MPQFVAAAVFAVKAIVVSITAGAISLGTAGAIASFVVKLAITVAVSAAMRALQPKPRGMDQGTELQTKLDPAYPREIMVGTAATGGSLVFEDSEGGSTNDNLWRVFALSDCEIEEITQVRGVGEALTFSGDIHTGLRACTSHFKTAGGSSCLYLRIHKGEEDQTADADLLAAFPSILTSDFRGRGVAYAVVKLIWDQDAWQGGLDLVFVGKGAKCYDPRDPEADPAWSDNAALIAGQYLSGWSNNGFRVVGLGASAEDVPEAELAAAADDCDDDISLLAGGTEKRYRAGGMISARETPREVLTHLMAAMAGRHVDRGGEIVLLPGVARSVTFDADETNEREMLADAPIAFAARRTANDRVNAILSTFVNPDDGFQEAPLPPRKNAAAITADGDRFETTRAYRFVQSKTQGQRLDEIELRRARCEKFVAFEAPLSFFELTPGDWFEAESPRWRNETVTFEVETVQLSIISGGAGGEPMARCAISARETASSVFDWTTADEITVANSQITTPTRPPGRRNRDDRINGAFAAGNPPVTGISAFRASNPLSSADVGTTATISVAANTIKTSDVNGATKSTALNAGSVTGVGFATTYYVFALDPDMAGGAVTYVAATSTEAYVTDNRYLYVGAITTVADGGGGGGFPPDCVALWAWLDSERQAGQIGAGDLIDVLGPAAEGLAIVQARVEDAHSARVDGVCIETESGAQLSCSATTPIEQPGGEIAWAWDALGDQAAVADADGLRWERIVAVSHLGPIAVRRIHVGGRTYGAGDLPGRRIFTHNPIKP